VVPAEAQQDAPTLLPSAVGTGFTADISPGELGWLRLRVQAPSGTAVAVQETTAGSPAVTLARLTLDGTVSGRARLAAWRCDRRARQFTVTADIPGAGRQTIPVALTTPSCRDRVRLRVATRRPTAQRPLTLELHDRWRTGKLPLRLCVRGPVDKAARCRAVDLTAATPTRRIDVAAPRSGRYRLELRGASALLVRRGVLVARRAGGQRLLATGDSQIQVLDGLLANRLRGNGIKVTSDAHVGTGVTKLFQLNWLQHALTSARSVRPDITVVFLGANDGYPIGSIPCCGTAWSRGYAGRVVGMMRSYARRGAGRVYWFLLPAPRRPAYATVFAAVNRALRLAAPRVPAVRLVDLGPALTPGGGFRQTVRYRGRTVNVRQRDGIHLSVGGYQIALDVLLAAMRDDGGL
jgi:lysophospholipase L1-like esterase